MLNIFNSLYFCKDLPMRLGGMRISARYAFHAQGSSWTLPWRHNGRDSVSNHQPHHCLLNRLFGRRSKKTSKLRVTGLCAGDSPGTGEFSIQMACNAENVSIWWRHHENVGLHTPCAPVANGSPGHYQVNTSETPPSKWQWMKIFIATMPNLQLKKSPKSFISLFLNAQSKSNNGPVGWSTLKRRYCCKRFYRSWLE